MGIFPIFQKNYPNIFLPIYIILGIVPPIYDKYDNLGGGGIPQLGGV
jgi:hypothetical protein